MLTGLFVGTVCAVWIYQMAPIGETTVYLSEHGSEEQVEKGLDRFVFYAYGAASASVIGGLMTIFSGATITLNVLRSKEAK